MVQLEIDTRQLAKKLAAKLNVPEDQVYRALTELLAEA
jgi:hypothetical protein